MSGDGAAPFGAEPEVVRRRLLRWYRRVRRDLPWRGTTDPYRVWVSEVMLQQTRVAVAIPFYERVLEAFPTMAALAQADLSEVLRLWEGLGYYSRARNLHRGARCIVAEFGGRFPEALADALRVPGVGLYTAGAVLSICYGRRLPAVDANAERVLLRLSATERDPRSAEMKADLRAAALALLPRSRPGDLNQALMELGALVCLPRAPRCTECPCRDCCLALRLGAVERIPPRRERRVAPREATVAAVVARRGRYLVGRRGAGGIWAGLWEFPWGALEDGASAEEALGRLLATRCGLELLRHTPLVTVRHGLMERTVELSAHSCRARGRAVALFHEEIRWALPEELPALAMPMPHRRIAEGLTRARTGGSPHS